MKAGVSKSGSPAPKPTTSMPAFFIALALALTARVIESATCWTRAASGNIAGNSCCGVLRKRTRDGSGGGRRLQADICASVAASLVNLGTVMCTMPRRRLVLLAFVLCVNLTAAIGVEADEVLEKIQSITSTASATELPVADWKVTESVLGKQRQVDILQREASRIIQLDNVCYVAEKGTPRWLVGSAVENHEIRCEHAFDSLDALMQGVKFADLPKPPKGLALREVSRLPAGPTRIASDGKGQTLYVLCVNGDVWQIDVKSGATTRLIRSESYIDLKQGEERVCCGMTLAPDGRLYLVCNQKLTTASPYMNQVTIFRTAPRGEGDPSDPKPWLRASYPWGIGPFNHGVDHIA